jgi:hypothetical protein
MIDDIAILEAENGFLAEEALVVSVHRGEFE